MTATQMDLFADQYVVQAERLCRIALSECFRRDARLTQAPGQGLKVHGGCPPRLAYLAGVLTRIELGKLGAGDTVCFDCYSLAPSNEMDPRRLACPGIDVKAAPFTNNHAGRAA